MLTLGPFIKHLVNEHEVVGKQLDALEFEIENLSKEGVVERIRAQLNHLRYIVEDVHHKNEEELLFPELHSRVNLKEGGPECARFMTLKQFSDPAQIIFKQGKKRGHDAEVLLKRNKSELLESPLIIPMEEHVAGQIAIHLAEFEIANLLKHNSSSEALASLRKIITTYISLMRHHIQKENECLFVLADQHIPANIQEKMLEKVNLCSRGQL